MKNKGLKAVQNEEEENIRENCLNINFFHYLF